MFKLLSLHRKRTIYQSFHGCFQYRTCWLCRVYLHSSVLFYPSVSRSIDHIASLPTTLWNTGIVLDEKIRHVKLTRTSRLWKKKFTIKFFKIKISKYLNRYFSFTFFSLSRKPPGSSLPRNPENFWENEEEKKETRSAKGSAKLAVMRWLRWWRKRMIGTASTH